MTDLLVATNNVGKQEEFRRLLASLSAPLLMPADIGLALVPDEPHDTYTENATAKALAFCRASGLLTVADDAGIEVAALDWGPGVRTARFGDDVGRGGGADAPRGGVELLLARLAGQSDRRARMVCCVAIAIPGGGEPSIEVYQGTMEGVLTEEPRGTGGFGFDPVFEGPDGLTNAELPAAEKDRRSHRGKAVAEALPRLRALLG